MNSSSLWLMELFVVFICVALFICAVSLSCNKYVVLITCSRKIKTVNIILREREEVREERRE